MVSRLRLLGDYVHSTCIAFVEFAQAESAIRALSFSGVAFGLLPIRVSPSKTPVRPRSPRVMSN
uniref:Polyadenylate-binding protein-interacting protein 8 n=1 Tax=Garnotia stricta var. longiseta TaxID=2358306 RepID=A0A5P8N4J2_9POAL|nr:polyadenylate-binding protein-interacting protein 8 [Garnotia stricta var. longiseta]